MAISDWSTTAADNDAAPPNGWPEGMQPGAVNNVGRQMMADIRTFYNNTPLLDANNTLTGTNYFSSTAAGSFRFGTTSNPVGLSAPLAHIDGGSLFGLVITGDSLNALQVYHSTPTAGDNGFVAFGTEASYSGRGSITYNRAGGLVAYNTSSDARLKENIVDAPSAMAVVDALRVRSFDWISGPHVDYWFVAQELHQVFPMAVTVGGHDIAKPWSVDPSKLVPVLVKAVQELSARVAALEAE